jgi:hypothetical protein
MTDLDQGCRVLVLAAGALILKIFLNPSSAAVRFARAPSGAQESSSWHGRDFVLFAPRSWQNGHSSIAQ